MSSSNMGSRSTPRAMDKKLRFCAEGISLNPSAASLADATAADRPVTPFKLFKST